MQKDRSEQRVSRGLVVITVLALVTMLASIIPSPYTIERPGPVVDTLGEIEGEQGKAPVISLEGVETHETTGVLNLLSVTMVGSPEHPTHWLDLVRPLFDPSQNIVHQSEVFVPGETSEERDEYNAVLMGSSQTLAAVAALHELGERVPGELTIAYVDDAGPANGILENGDVVLTANGVGVASVDELRSVVAEAGSGGVVALRLIREGEPLTVEVVPEAAADGSPPMLGVALAEDFELPFEVEMSVEDIGGSSAGMVFALAIYDRLTPGDLLGDLTVSGTGTISGSGEVGQIGGITQKLWGAHAANTDLFLFPVSNCAEIPERVPDDMEIVPVETLGEAITAIERASAGESVGGLERCAVDRSEG